MSTRCTRCRGLDGAHHPWCIQAVLWEHSIAGQVAVNGPLPTWHETEEVEQSVATEVSGDLVAELREQLRATEANASMLRDANANLGTMLDGARDEVERLREEFRQLEQANRELALRQPSGDMSVIDTAGGDVTAIQAELRSVTEKLNAQSTALAVLKGELRTAQQQRDHALRERDQVRKTLRDPDALREQRRAEAARIRESVEAAQRAQGERVVDFDAGQTEPSRPTPETVRERMERRVAEAVAEVEAAGATAEVIEPRSELSAEELAKAEYANEATQRETAAAVRPQSGAAEDVAAAAELFVSEKVTKAHGKRLTSDDLMPVFAAWLPSVGVTPTTDNSMRRHLGVAMTAAGFARRQIRDVRTGSAPVNYLDAALVVGEDELPRGSVHPGELSEPQSPADTRDPVQANADMARAARQAKRPPDNKTALGNEANMPGKELRSEEIRKMAYVLVSEQGFTYTKAKRGHPQLMSPSGKRTTLPTTPGDRRSFQKCKSDLRRMGAVLP